MGKGRPTLFDKEAKDEIEDHAQHQEHTEDARPVVVELEREMIHTTLNNGLACSLETFRRPTGGLPYELTLGLVKEKCP